MTRQHKRLLGVVDRPQAVQRELTDGPKTRHGPGQRKLYLLFTPSLDLLRTRTQKPSTTLMTVTCHGLAPSSILGPKVNLGARLYFVSPKSFVALGDLQRK